MNHRYGRNKRQIANFEHLHDSTTADRLMVASRPLQAGDSPHRRAAGPGGNVMEESEEPTVGRRSGPKGNIKMEEEKWNGSNWRLRAPKKHKTLSALRQPSLLSLVYLMEARVGIEPTHKGFADLSLTTWVPRPERQKAPAAHTPRRS